MKKLFGYTAGLVMLAGMLPTVVLADLQCFVPPYTSNPMSVQNAAQCAGEPAGMLYDTNSGTWTNPRTGKEVSDPSNSSADSQQTASNQAYEQCMSVPGNSAENCQASAKQQTGAAPSNLDIQVRTLTPYTSQPTYSNPSAVSASDGGSRTSGAGSRTITYTPLEPLPGDTENTYSSLSAYLTLMFNILLSIGAMIAVVTLVLAGITYMVSEVVDKKTEARRRIQAAIVGLLLLLTCWLILFTVNPGLTKLELATFDKTPPGSSAALGAAKAQPTDAAANAALKACAGTVQPDPATNTPTCYPNL